MDNSFRYIFINRFSYLLIYYYSFLAHYNKKCFDIDWFHLLSPAILSLLVFSLWGHMTFERWHQNSKTRVRFVYMKNLNMLNESSHTCDRVAMLQLEICKFLAGDLVSYNWRFFIDVFVACFYCLLMFSFCLFQYWTNCIPFQYILFTFLSY